MTTTATKERPILFSREMVRAIFTGEAQRRVPVTTSTSTVLGYPASSYWKGLNFDLATPHQKSIVAALAGDSTDPHLSVPWRHAGDSSIPWEECGRYRVRPRWEIGERLWVCEMWAPHYAGFQSLVHYRADLPDDPSEALSYDHAFGLMQWRSAFEMKRVHSRLTVEVTAIEMEKVGGSICENDSPWIWILKFKRIGG